MDLTGKVALITGAGYRGGLGRIIAHILAEKGAVLFLNDIDEASCMQQVDVMKSQGFTVYGQKGDVSQYEQVQEMVAAILKKVKRIHILVNNAGIRSSGDLPIIGEEEIERVLNVNLKGVINTTKAILPSMKENQYGRIISIASMTGKIGGGEYNTSTTIYSASKAGIGGFTRSLAREVGEYNITVNAISPGIIDLGEKSRQRSPEVLASIMEHVAIKRLGAPEDVAYAVAFLASKEAGYITGVDLDVSGGLSMGF